MKILMIYCFIMIVFVVLPLALKLQTAKASKAKKDYLAMPAAQINTHFIVGGKLVLNGLGKGENSINRR